MNNYRLIQGDCLKVLKKLEKNSVDAIVTDPPFAYAGGKSAGRASEVSDQFFLHWWKEVCHLFDYVLKQEGEGFIWCDWRSSSLLSKGFVYDQYRGLRISQMLYHYREMGGMGAPFRNSVDMIAYIRGSKSKGSRIPNTTHNLISKYWYYGKHKHHPAEKDVKIVEKLLEWCSDEGDIILDPFLGGGTTMLACQNLKRSCIGIEHESRYCETVKKRCFGKTFLDREVEYSFEIQ